jgi:prevent-host-death family protein
MTQVNMHEAKTNFSRLIAAIKSGRETEIVVAQNGVPAARIVPILKAKKPRVLGAAKGEFTFDYEAFQALDVDVQAMFDESIERDHLRGW